MNKLTFLKWALCLILILIGAAVYSNSGTDDLSVRLYDGVYKGENLNYVAFPIGGIGAGMICLEGTGAISHVSVRNKMELYNEPCMFAAIHVKGAANGAKILEGPVPKWKYFGIPMAGRGSKGMSYGLPRFTEATFNTRFPFGTVRLSDSDIKLQVEVTGWSPFIPSDADNSSLPVGGIEYRFTNPTGLPVEAVFSYHSRNFMATQRFNNTVLPLENGFILSQSGTPENPENEGAFGISVDDENVVVDHSWYRGDHYDDITLVWKAIAEGRMVDNPPQKGASPGASLYLPFTLKPGETKVITLKLAWFVPKTNLRLGTSSPEVLSCDTASTHAPWYTTKFGTLNDVVEYWRKNYDNLRANTTLFTEAFYNTSLPDVVIEAVAANLTILKSPTILRQTDGRLWAFEGCSDDQGCCPGSCTHVWNYAQAIPHLFPDLERTFRHTEYNESQSEAGRQTFRSSLPIRAVSHDPSDFLPGRFAAADGQLGGIMKVYREWRISGDTEWLRNLWPQVKSSMDYCIKTWDPRETGTLEEPQHNTYDIQFWGPNGMLTSFYLGALKAMAEMSKAMGEDITYFSGLFAKGEKSMESDLFNGEYFYQKVRTDGLTAVFNPLNVRQNGAGYSEVITHLNQEGPKYQYGTGCLSDGVLGIWIARMCGLGEIVDKEKVQSHLLSVYKYNLRTDLTDHSNPQRPSYALGDEGGLLLCTWPRGGAVTLPFIYSNEVWTGIEYQVASHLMLEGFVEEGLEIVRLCRDRYDGRVRNPFNEYECGHWYARAMSSYGLLQGLTGVFYDAIDKTLYIDSKIGDNFKSFFSCQSGFGTVGLANGKPFVNLVKGSIDIDKYVISGKVVNL